VTPPQVEATILGFRLVVGLVLLRAGLTKLPKREVFAQAVINYGLVPEGASRVIARLLPQAEVILGAMLIAGLAQPVAGSVVAALLLVFAFAVGVNLLRGRQIDCGCFGPGAPNRIDTWTVVRDVILAAAAFGIALRPTSTLSVDSVWLGAQGGRSLAASDALAIGLASFAGLLIHWLFAESRRVREHAAVLHRGWDDGS
jgi:hypothetical protein